MLDHEIVAGIQFFEFAIEHQSHPQDNNIATSRARDNRADVNVCCCVIECSISRCDYIERSESFWAGIRCFVVIGKHRYKLL